MMSWNTSRILGDHASFQGATAVSQGVAPAQIVTSTPLATELANPPLPRQRTESPPGLRVQADSPVTK